MKLAMSMKRVEVYRFESFAPVRENNHVQFLIDGEDYFSNLAMEIERAESRILICGWWISPEFYLIRPVKEHENYRFDRLLRRVAEKGVKIFILVYYEPKYLTNDSRHTKKIL